MGSHARISLLGPIQVHDGDGDDDGDDGDDGARPVAGTKQQALLALLALAVPGPVPDDRLADELWGDDPPGNAANALQAQVSQLRRTLGRAMVVRHGRGYALAVAPEDVDALRLQQLVAEGRAAAAANRPDDASARYRAAVALVRGAALYGLTDHPFAHDAAAHLDALVLAAREGLVDAELALGRHAELVDDLARLVTEHPLRERFHAQRITALYRCGRQSEALRAYQDVRALLADELGLDPGEELQALERSVLTHDPALAAPVALTAAPAPPVPAWHNSFVGREAELAALGTAAEANRLVTVVGPGGVGKTRLVVQALQGPLRAWREIWFVELAPVTAPLAVAETIASAVGARDDGAGPDPRRPRSPEVRTVERLQDRAVMLVLDNCEHVADAAADVARALLAGCARLSIVATSRGPLGVAGEHQIPLGPLPEGDAARLFTDRATAVQPLFGRDRGEGGSSDDGDGSAAEIAELCRQLDGLPLAIELAAARAKTLPVAEMTARLDRRFDLLRATSPTAAGRHRGLRAAIDASYDLLFADERAAFERLSVFAGGATVEAVEAVCGPDALDLVARLVDRSLLVADTSGRHARFRMLESLRAYGLERLAERDELTAANAAHARWCVALAEAAHHPVRSADQLPWLARLDAEHDNFRAALTNSLADQPDLALRLVAELIMPWWFRGRRQEARHWAEAALAAAPPDAAPVARAMVLALCGLVAESGGWTGDPGGLEHELALADERQQEAIALCERHGARLEGAYARGLLIVTRARRASLGVPFAPAELDALAREALRDLDAAGDQYGLASIHVALATAAIARGDTERVAIEAEHARTHAQRSGDRFALSRVQWLQGQLAGLAGDARRAYRHVEASTRLVDELGMAQVVTAQARFLARFAAQAGQPDLAAQWEAFVAGRPPAWTYYDLMATAAAANVAGLHARSQGDHERARAEHEAAVALYEEADAALGQAFGHSCLGFLAAAADDPDRAAHHHALALDAAASTGAPAALALALEGMAGTWRAARPERAARLLGAARARWAAAGDLAEASHRADVEVLASALRAALGAPELERLVAEGTSLATADALALARTAPA